MVWMKLGPTTTTRKSQVNVLISLLLVSLFSLMFDVFSGGDGRRTGFSFVEGASGKSDGGAGAIFSITGGGVGSSGGYGPPSNVGIAIAVTVMAGLAVAVTLVYSNRGQLKSPWPKRRRKHALQPKQWRAFFDGNGRLCDGGVNFLKKVRSGVCCYLNGVHPSLRAEVWPYLLGVYDLKSSKEERNAVRAKNRKEFETFRKQCQRTYKKGNKSTSQIEEIHGNESNEDSEDDEVIDSSAASSRNSISPEEEQSVDQNQSDDPGSDQRLTSSEGGGSQISCTSDSNSCNKTEKHLKNDKTTHSNTGGKRSNLYRSESFSTWKRIIRLDAIRANDEWIAYSPSQASVTLKKAHELAKSVCLKEYNHLEACRIFHAARLVLILEAYALHDSQIGYCQGMSDLLSPIISVVEDDSEAFWCFVGFMKKARHNFRVDEVGIRRQLNLVSKIIKGKDALLFRHLEEMQAEDCFFVYRMIVVLFRRELTFEQTLCMWEVMWADQTAIRAGITKSEWGRGRLPTDDLLLYAIAACVLQRRKQIMEKYSSMDEILRDCNSMAGRLDVWELIDDAHELVVTLNGKI